LVSNLTKVGCPEEIQPQLLNFDIEGSHTLGISTAGGRAACTLPGADELIEQRVDGIGLRRARCLQQG
jgi:hypothetical protein